MNIPSVLIILATFNGSKYLSEQLSSVFSQLNVQVSIVFSDDISNDNTLDIVTQFCSSNFMPLLVIPNIEQSGSACNNFLRAIKRVSANYDYFALCDQDDVWLPNKLCRSIRLMIESSADAYSSSLITYSVEANKFSFKYCSKPILPLSFLTQSASAGCTYVLSQRAFSSLKDSLNNLEVHPKYSSVFSHDVYIHQVTRISGFAWIYDKVPSILYRQHSLNEWGARGFSIASGLKRFRMLFGRTFFDSIRNGYLSAAIHKPSLLNFHQERDYRAFTDWVVSPSINRLPSALLALRQIYREPYRVMVMAFAMLYYTFLSR